MAEVTLHGVSKVFGRGRSSVTAVEGVDLDVSDGEFVVLLGPSGCGKTTTLRMIAGLETPTGGSISIGGRVVNDVPPKDRDVALVFQSFALYPHMTVAGNLGFGLKMRRTPKAEIADRVAETAAMLEIEDLLDRRPDELSGGQQQRVALGRAIIRRPAVYLFDEPLANLDTPLRVQMRRNIRRMHRELGMTAVYVTHDQQEAMSLADRVAVMRSGRIEQYDRPQTLYEAPANRFVAGFVGSPPMSLIAVDLTRDGNGGSMRCGDERWALSETVCDRLPPDVAGPLVMGLRPEQVRLSSQRDGADRATVAVTIDVIERFGDRCDVHGRLSGGESLIATMAASQFEHLEEGARVWASFDMTDVALFETDKSGRSVMSARVGVGSRVS